MIFIYGILYPLHQQMGGMHCQVGEGVVTLGDNYDYYHYHPGDYQETYDVVSDSVHKAGPLC